MSDLLNKASLVVIPSGYKEDTVYSVVPSDGSGDLSFTRASNGTRINSAGLVEVTPWNLVQYSEDFSNAVWTTANLSISANTTTAPNGTTTADTITEDTSTTRKILYTTPTIVANQEITLTIYVKKNTLQYVRLIANDLSENFRWFGAQFNLTALTYTSATGSNGNATFTSASITDAGNGWYRIAVSGTINTTSLLFGIFPSDGTALSSSDDRGGNTYLGTGKTAYIWGAQLNIGSTAKPYFPTTDRLNVPRLTYQNGGGGCPSLLLEKQSTNLILYSEDLTQSNWTKANSSITANNTTSPDGTQNADKVVEDTANSTHGGFQAISVTNGIPYTWSGFFKAAGRTKFRLFAQSASTPYVEYDLSNGTIFSITGSVTATIESVGNGWYKCTATSTTSGTTAFLNFAILDSSNNVSYTGDGTSGIFVWGAQLEASSYPTSYIPTTSSSATRVADACFKTGISSLIGQTEGTAFVEIKTAIIDSAGQIILSLDDGTTSNRMEIFALGSGAVGFYIETGGASQANTVSSFTLQNNMKLAFAYKQNDFVLYINGTQVGTDTTGTVPTASAFRLQPNVSGSGFSVKSYGEAVLFKTRLTNAELASLTTI